MDNISTEIEAGRLTAPRPSKPGVKAWAGSLIALGLVAGGVIAGPRLLAPSADQAAVVTPPVVAVSVPLQRDVNAHRHRADSGRRLSPVGLHLRHLVPVLHALRDHHCRLARA